MAEICFDREINRVCWIYFNFRSVIYVKTLRQRGEVNSTRLQYGYKYVYQNINVAGKFFLPIRHVFNEIA